MEKMELIVLDPFTMAISSWVTKSARLLQMVRL